MMWCWEIMLKLLNFLIIFHVEGSLLQFENGIRVFYFQPINVKLTFPKIFFYTNVTMNFSTPVTKRRCL